MNRERNEIAMPVVSGYSMVMYCQYCMDHLEVAFDGPDCYHSSRRYARNRGWTFHKDGYCTCKNCKTKQP